MAVATAAAYTLFGQPQMTLSQTGTALTGYAWSDTIGWISMSGSNYGFAISSDGTITGEGWSENIGWVSAEHADGLHPAPSIGADGKFSGWLKAVAGGTDQSGGWDGWISLSGVSPAYGVKMSLQDGTIQPCNATTQSCAWGSDVVGWVDFSKVETEWLPCTPTYQCVDLTHWQKMCGAVVMESGTCNASLICTGGAIDCVIPADANGFLTLSPQLVPTGDTTEVSWDVEGTASCVVTSDGDDGWELTGGDEDSGTSHAIVETTTFTLTCTNELGENPTVVDTETAVVVPTWVER